MSKINVSVGTRAESPQAPVEYEIPRDVVAEAIVNAVAHRDYTSNASVQVMLFSDRLEVWNPGTLPPTLTLQSLRERHGSHPRNPLLAEPLYLTRYIERMGTGTRDMIRKCREAGLAEPEFKLTDGFVATVWRPRGAAVLPDGTKRHQVGTKLAPSGTRLGLSPDQVEILRKCFNPRAIGELMEISGRTNRTKFRDQVLRPLLDEGLVEMAIPDKPTSSKQQYRTTTYGRELLNALRRNAEK
jgi:predicted HTH transcriptional regulator